MKWHSSVQLLLLATLQLHLFAHSATCASTVIVRSEERDGPKSTTVSDDDHFLVKRDLFERGLGSGLYVDINSTQSLVSALQNITSHTTVHLEPGNYTLEEFVLVRDMTSITLEGDGYKEGVSIQCVEDAGLAFINVSQLSFRNITIDGCGFNQSDIDSTLAALDDIVNVFYEIPRVVRIALFMGHCEDMIMDNVSIVNTRGFGLVGINVIGTSQIKNSLFYNNTNPGPCINMSTTGNTNSNFTEAIEDDSLNQLGGAATFMYFDYHNQTRYNRGNFGLIFDNCNFSFNAECSLIYLNLYRSPGQGESRFVTDIGYRLGGSAGFGLTLAQLGYGMDITTTSSTFNDNSGRIGGGHLIVMFTGVKNTHVIVDNCLFNRSKVLFINEVKFPESTEFNNIDALNRDITVSFVNSRFANNGVESSGTTCTIYSNYFFPPNDVNEVVKVYFDQCHFKYNRAYVGAAILIYEYKISGFNIGIQVSIKDTEFVNNEIVTADPDATITISQSAGIVDIRNVNLTLHGNCSFIDNAGTALRAESSLVGVNGNITFLRNTGINGGALHLVSYAYLIMNRNSSVYFIDNQARIGGGAIYVNENGLNSYLIGGFVDCFIHFAYDNFIICESCSDLNDFRVYIKFSGNIAPSGSMVWGSSLATCPWAVSLLLNNSQNQSLFEILDKDYYQVFDFDQPPNDPSLVRSTASRLIVSVESTRQNSNNVTKVFPGEVFFANISAIDDFHNTISNVIAAFAFSNETSSNETKFLSPFLSSNAFAVLDNNIPTRVPIRVLGMENQNVSLVIYSSDLGGRAQEQINITINSCGFGFQFNTNEYFCDCDSRINDADFGITCNIENQSIIVPDNIWIGPFNNQNDDVVVHECLFRYCKPGVRNISIESPEIEMVNFDSRLCDSDMNRVGLLCGSCSKSFSAVLGTRRCKRCSNWYVLLFPVFIIIGILAILTIRYLNINITAGFINGAIFYSNIVSIYGDTLVPDASLTNGPTTLVSFLTLNLGFETCLHDKMTTLEKIWWQLSFPLYLFILMIITTLLARTKCLKFDRSAGLGTIQAFATLLILCYVSVLEVCIELIAFVRIDTLSGTLHYQWRSDPSLQYFGSQHGVLGFLAYLILLVYIIPLPFFLLFPSALYRNRYLSKFKPIYDAFWDPFQLKCRFYLGFRLIFRWIPFLLAITVSPPTNLFITNFLLVLLLVLQISLQPFRDKWRNNIDALFVLNLVLVFLGSIFFWSKYAGADQNDRRLITRDGLIYISIFIILSFLLMVSIVVYHLTIRFPRLNNIISRLWNKTPLTKVYNVQLVEEITESVDTPSDNSATLESAKEKTTEVKVTTTEIAIGQTSVSTGLVDVCHSSFSSNELREPLLEFETADIYEVDPSSLPTRVQTSYHNTNN